MWRSWICDSQGVTIPCRTKTAQPQQLLQLPPEAAPGHVGLLALLRDDLQNPAKGQLH